MIGRGDFRSEFTDGMQAALFKQTVLWLGSSQVAADWLVVSSDKAGKVTELNTVIQCGVTMLSTSADV